MRRSRMLFSAVMLVGCGGKIVETAPFAERDRVAFTEPQPDVPEAQEPPAPPATLPFEEPTPTPTTPLGACEVLCERDARCDTTLPALPVKEGEGGDCKTRCETRLSRDTCGIDGWLLCYAGYVEPSTCTPLPADCRPAFCAWARCAKQPVSNCE